MRDVSLNDRSSANSHPTSDENRKSAMHWVFNKDVHRLAKASLDAFLDKTAHVKAIRVAGSFPLSWYVTNEEEWLAWDVLWNIVQNGEFSGIEFVTPHRYVFAVALPEELMNWLSATDHDEVKETVVRTMRCLYQRGGEVIGWHGTGSQHIVAEREDQEHLRRQVWSPLQDKVCVDCADTDDMRWFTSAFYEWMCSCSKYFEVNHILKSGMFNVFDLSFAVAYFRKDDWLRIIGKGEGDALRRAEAKDDVWQQWRYESMRSQVKIRKRSKRVPIAPSRRFEILKRDGFKCQLCGISREDGAQLEVDHRIPVTKGGSNDDHNLWTLCFDCNRGKGLEIV